MLKGKRVLVTGACGTVGSELMRQLLHQEHQVSAVIGIDNNESALFFLEQSFLRDKRAVFYLADVRDYPKLSRVMQEVDIVFHAAAFKHVILCERSPFEAVQTNIMGVQNVIHAASDNNVEKVIFTSSDKAVNPTSVMGVSKLMGEKLITAANSNRLSGQTCFASTRFGNVLGSRGSVIPIFKNQISKGGPVTLTHPDMSRFIMSIEEAVNLVINSVYIVKGGEVLITKMPAVRILDLAQVMIDHMSPLLGRKPEDIAIETIGVKPGEKLYEELMSQEECRRSVELENYFSVLPAFRGIYHSIDYDYPDIASTTVSDTYTSSGGRFMSKQDLLNALIRWNLLDTDEPEEQYATRYWPGEKEQQD